MPTHKTTVNKYFNQCCGSDFNNSATGPTQNLKKIKFFKNLNKHLLKHENILKFAFQAR